MALQWQAILASALAVLATGGTCLFFRSKGAPIWQKARLWFFAVLFFLFLILLACYVSLVKEPFATALMVLGFSAFLGLKILLVVLPLALSLLSPPDRRLHVYVWLVIGVALILVATILSLGGQQWYVSGDDWLWGAIAAIYFASSFLACLAGYFAEYWVVTALTPLTTKSRVIAIVDGVAIFVSATLADLYRIWPQPLHLALQGFVAITSVFLNYQLEISGWPNWIKQGSANTSDDFSTVRNSAASSSFGNWEDSQPPNKVSQGRRKTDEDMARWSNLETQGTGAGSTHSLV